MTLPRDAAYASSARVDTDIVTTDEVLSEYLTVFARAPYYLRSRAAMGVRAALQAASVRVIPQSRETFLFGVELYAARPDKGYSLTDCISMETMRREGLTDVLTMTGTLSKKASEHCFATKSSRLKLGPLADDLVGLLGEVVRRQS